MQANITHLHRFNQDISTVSRPEAFTFPFYYEPHPLSVLAAQQVQEYLMEQKDFQHNFGLKDGMPGLEIGKMFGVLVVEDAAGHLGFLAACSGKLAGTNQHRYFIPPIFDMLDPEGFFIQEEHIINALNRKIERLEANPEIAAQKAAIQTTILENEQ